MLREIDETTGAALEVCGKLGCLCESARDRRALRTARFRYVSALPSAVTWVRLCQYIRSLIDVLKTYQKREGSQEIKERKLSGTSESGDEKAVHGVCQEKTIKKDAPGSGKRICSES